MTKVALKGPVNGTGTYTLRAPETANTLELELPLAGTHLAGADANGMPLIADGTPVVESGSNSDGDWFRSSDGIQVCIKLATDNLPNGVEVGGVYVSEAVPINLAQAFVGSYSASIGVGQGGAVNGFWGVIVGSANSNLTHARAYRNTLFSTGDIGAFQITAVGRWK